MIFLFTETVLLMKTLHLLLPMLLLVMLATVASGAEMESMRLSVDHEQREQGQFFTVTVTDPPEEPVLWFMDRSYRMFCQVDNSWRALLPVENLTLPGSYPLRLQSGSSEQKMLLAVAANNRPIQQIALDSSKAELKATEIEKSRVKAALHTESLEKLFAGSFVRPASGRTSSLFGLKRSYNGGPLESYHKGVDISAPQGRAVQSTAKGRVILTGTVDGGFQVHGNTVIIDHGQALISIYMHLSAISVHEGQLVEAGEVIGNVGHTGISTAPHLHWGTYLYGISVDPELFEGKVF
jgi:murein DD-endopeptidase MepM/ murein hydrolase activator NlpD